MNSITKTALGCFVAAIFITACSGDEGTGPITVASVTVRAPSDTVRLGDSLQLTAEVRDDAGNLLTGRVVAWSSDNAAASVSTTGVVRATAPGRVTVTATAEGRSGSMALTASPFSWRTVAAGGSHTCAVRNDGRAYCWGSTPQGNLGLHVPAPLPMEVGGGYRWTSLVAGGGFTCGIVQNGQTACWGTFGTSLISLMASPKLVEDDPKFRVLAAGGMHVCGIGQDGRTYCWGDNFYGQLGIGFIDGVQWGNRSAPTPVAGDFKFTVLAPGEGTTCALTATGEKYCFTRQGPQPMPGAIRFDSLVVGGDHGREHRCGIAGNTTYCEGFNTSGQAGVGYASDFSLGYTVPLSRVQTPAGVSFRTLTAGGTGGGAYKGHTCGISTQDDLYCWGDNGFGQLGDGTVTNRPVPVQVAAGMKFREVSAGGAHTCATTAAGELYCWGNGRSGQLGNRSSGSNVFSATPVLVSL